MWCIYIINTYSFHVKRTTESTGNSNFWWNTKFVTPCAYCEEPTVRSCEQVIRIDGQSENQLHFGCATSSSAKQCFSLTVLLNLHVFARGWAEHRVVLSKFATLTNTTNTQPSFNHLKWCRQIPENTHNLRHSSPIKWVQINNNTLCDSVPLGIRCCSSETIAIHQVIFSALFTSSTAASYVYHAQSSSCESVCRLNGRWACWEMWADATYPKMHKPNVVCP